MGKQHIQKKIFKDKGKGFTGCLYTTSYNRVYHIVYIQALSQLVHLQEFASYFTRFCSVVMYKRCT